MNLNLQLSDITKVFGEKTVYDRLNYTFTKGCYAVYGQNGMGKSVLLEMIAGVIRQDAGLIKLNATLSNHTQQYKMRMTFVPSVPSFFPMVDGNEFLSFVQSIKKTADSLNNLEQDISSYKLNKHLTSKFNQMSLGTQKKLFLTTLSISDSDLIILDEPTNGLDDESSQYLIEKVKALSERAIVIIATHDTAFMSEINHTAIHLEKSPITDFQWYK